MNTTMNTPEFKIGCDPELFLMVEDQPLSAHGVIPGNKKKPYTVPHGAIQVDGLAVEYNINPVTVYPMTRHGAAAFVDTTTVVEDQLLSAVRKKHPDAHFDLTPAKDFGEEFMKAQPRSAKVLGCDPDFNAYTLEPNPRPDPGNVRSLGGHIHCGWGADIPVHNEEHMKICADFVRDLDQSIGIYMTIIDRDQRRRELYGKAGAFRPKPYGVEYRTPSSVWLVSRMFKKHIFLLLNQTISEKIQRGSLNWTDDARRIIDEGDVDAAWKVAEERFPVSVYAELLNWELRKKNLEVKDV